MIDWKAIEKISEDDIDHNQELLFYAYQKKLGRAQTPSILVGWYEEGEVRLHEPFEELRYNGRMNLTTLTHYAKLNEPWDNE